MIFLWDQMSAIPRLNEKVNKIGSTRTSSLLKKVENNTRSVEDNHTSNLVDGLVKWLFDTNYLLQT